LIHFLEFLRAADIELLELELSLLEVRIGEIGVSYLKGEGLLFLKGDKQG